MLRPRTTITRMSNPHCMYRIFKQHPWQIMCNMLCSHIALQPSQDLTSLRGSRHGPDKFLGLTRLQAFQTCCRSCITSSLSFFGSLWQIPSERGIPPCYSPFLVQVLLNLSPTACAQLGRPPGPLLGITFPRRASHS